MNSLRVITAPWSRTSAATLVLVSAFVFSGCHSLPDVQPFADATSKLRHTIASSGNDAVNQVRLIGEKNSATVTNAIEIANNLAKELAADWDARNKVMEGLDGYASALAGVVQAGNEGAKSAKAVG